MDVLDRPVHLDATEPSHQATGEFRWAVIMTRRDPGDPNAIIETYKVVHTPDQLCQLILHSSLDPNVLAYTYHRYIEPDTTPRLTACDFCDEDFDDTPPRQQWRLCGCGGCHGGGHIIYTCRTCGADQIEPAQAIDDC